MKYKYQVEKRYKGNKSYYQLVRFNPDNLHDFQIVDTSRFKVFADMWLGNYDADYIETPKPEGNK